MLDPTTIQVLVITAGLLLALAVLILQAEPRS